MTNKGYEQSFEAHVESALARIETKLDALKVHHDDRLTKVEGAIVWMDRKQWIHSAIIIPLTTALVTATRYFLHR